MRRLGLSRGLRGDERFEGRKVRLDAGGWRRGAS